MDPNDIWLYPYVKRLLECREHTQMPRDDRFSKQYYKTTRYIDFRSTMNLNTYTLVHILHLLCTLTIYLLIYTYTCTSVCHFIVLCRCCSFCKLRVCGNSGLSDDSQHFSAIKYFKVKVCTFFRQNIQHTEQCRVNMFICTGKPENLCDSLYCQFSLLRQSGIKPGISQRHACRVLLWLFSC